MKKNIIYKSLGILLLFSNLIGCSDNPVIDNPSGETFIYKIKIANGGLTGTETFDGTIDEDKKEITFDIPAESDIQNIKFNAKLSLGAKMDKEAYDFGKETTLPVTVINGENQGTYNVNIKLDSPKETPIITTVRVKLKDGTLKNGYVSEIDHSLYLGCESEESVEIDSISCLPKRTLITFTKANNNIINKNEAGTVKLDFLGISNEYRILFASTPVFGADFKLGVNYDFTSGANNLFPDFKGENTRSADFDGNKLLIVSREGGNNPKVLSFEEIASGNPTGTLLNTTGIEGGTYLISAGRISHNHFYICNLSTKIGADLPLKIYHWSNLNATPEVIMEFTGDANGTDLSGNRLGDNISVNLDENGNGYIFLVSQNGTTMLRLDVTNFTKITNPTYIVPPITASYYASVNQVDGKSNEFVITSVTAPIALIDKDGNPLYKMDIASIPVRCTDARIITFDSERYLIATSGRQGAWSKDPVQTFYVYDLSNGATTALALQNFEQGEKNPLFSFSLGGNYGSAPAANTGWGVINGKLRIMTAALKSGFAVFEFPEKQ